MLLVLDRAPGHSSFMRMLILFLAGVSIAKASLYSGAEEVSLLLNASFTMVVMNTTISTDVTYVLSMFVSGVQPLGM